MTRRQLVIGAALLGALGAGAARVWAWQSTPPQQPSSGAALVRHPGHIQPGLAETSGHWANLANPYDGNATRAAEGAKLFVAYNCMDCHGADGSGAMGPSLQDGRWHYGGSAGEIYESIYEGRPGGMPAWGGRIADDQIWRLVTYVQSLAKGHDVTTENFTGRTVERTGH